MSWVMKSGATPGPAWQRGRGGDRNRRDGRVAAGRGGDINAGGEGVKGRPRVGSKFTFYRMNPTAGGGIVPDGRPRSPAAGYAERWADAERTVGPFMLPLTPSLVEE
jgi:hypothetical protein